MKWTWNNTTQIGVGPNCVREELHRFVKPYSSVICLAGMKSINENECLADVEAALTALECKFLWIKGIESQNTDIQFLSDIRTGIHCFKPDILIAVGGGTVLDCAKFLALAAKLEEGKDLWEDMLKSNKFPDTSIPVGAIMTIASSGSEWNSNFVISNFDKAVRTTASTDHSFPVFSLIDPRYFTTLSQEQLIKSVFCLFSIVIDQFLTGEQAPMMDNFCLCLIKELYELGFEVMKPNPTEEILTRLANASAFSHNQAFMLGKEKCWGIHIIAHQIMIAGLADYGNALSIVLPHFLENQFDERLSLLAKMGDFVFHLEGNENDCAYNCLAKIREWRDSLGLPNRIGQINKACNPEIELGRVTRELAEYTGIRKIFGYKGHITCDDAYEILRHCIH